MSMAWRRLRRRRVDGDGVVTSPRSRGEKIGRRRGRFSVAKVRSNSRAAGPVRQYRRYAALTSRGNTLLSKYSNRGSHNVCWSSFSVVSVHLLVSNASMAASTAKRAFDASSSFSLLRFSLRTSWFVLERTEALNALARFRPASTSFLCSFIRSFLAFWYSCLRSNSSSDGGT